MLQIIGFLLIMALVSGILGFGGFFVVATAGIIQIFFYILLVSLIISVIMHLLRPPIPPQ